MFGFLKGKSKNRVNANNGEGTPNKTSNSKEKYKKTRKDKRGKKFETTTSGEASRDTAAQSENSRTEDSSKEFDTKSISNGISKNCFESISPSSSDTANTVSEISELQSMSSSCFNECAISNSSSRASIPSITTECNDECVSLNQESVFQSSTNNDDINNIKSLSAKSGQSEVHSNSTKINHSTDASNSVQKNSSKRSTVVQSNFAMKPPVIPRSPYLRYNKLCHLGRSNYNEDEESMTSCMVTNGSAAPSILGDDPYFGFSKSGSHSPGIDGRSSILSTPSSSSSSLSSLSLRPVSPSGRKTPPGPRMGTSGKLGSSPTPTRKAQRTNIKTNPKTTKTNYTPKLFPPANIEDKALPEVKSGMSESFDKINSSLNHLPSQSPTHISHPVNISSTPNENSLPTDLDQSYQSKTQAATSNKGRNSLSSLHSLESIPEIDNDHKSLEKKEMSSNKEIIRNDDIMSSSIASSSKPKMLPFVEEESITDDSSKDDVPSTCSNSTEAPELDMDISTKEALHNLSKTIEQEKEFTSSILKDLTDRCDEDSSESLREPEIKEHRLELIPSCQNLKNSITFTREDVPKLGNMAKSEYGHPDKENTKLEPTNNSESDSSLSMSPHSVEPTHAVFQIPLRRSCSREPTESPKRLSVERDKDQESPLAFDPNEESVSSQCTVEGHVALNFDRGRSDHKSPRVPRRRSSSAVRRQKLYEDIKKFTAETKEIQAKTDPIGESGRKMSSGNHSKLLNNSQEKPNYLKEVGKSLWGETARRLSTTDPLVPDQKSSVRKGKSNTFPRAAPKKLERSITVAEIKINVNNSDISNCTEELNNSNSTTSLQERRKMKLKNQSKNNPSLHKSMGDFRTDSIWERSSSSSSLDRISTTLKQSKSSLAKKKCSSDNDLENHDSDHNKNYSASEHLAASNSSTNFNFALEEKEKSGLDNSSFTEIQSVKEELRPEVLTVSIGTHK